MQPFAFELRVHLAPQGLTEQIAQEEVGFEELPILLQDVGQVVLTRVSLELAKEERGRDVAKLKRAGYPGFLLQKGGFTR